jgi:hypothetical protein
MTELGQVTTMPAPTRMSALDDPQPQAAGQLPAPNPPREVISHFGSDVYGAYWVERRLAGFGHRMRETGHAPSLPSSSPKQVARMLDSNFRIALRSA